ncbi:NAD(P)/FAD-dependent oxidoreductase [Desulfovibrio sp. OttesenSCG-928-A18]|nr:NAD(P)/FAD-dependent oxidoreductase [Desulfovibrio sp. OttesenSCG-928-A18]
MTEQHFDLLILGGGPAGTRAAFQAASAGMKTALVEACFLGGTCLNVGCIPTKYLLGGTAALPLLAVQTKYKTARGSVAMDLEALQKRKERFVKGSRQALEKQLKEAGVSLFQGKGFFSGPQSVLVRQGGENISLGFGKCIVATGSVPASFPGLAPDGKKVLSSAGLLNLSRVPERLLIVGGGAIGLELGEIFHRLGSKIIMAEAMPRILPSEDEEVSKAAQAHFTREGWTLHTGRRIADLSSQEEGCLLRFEDGEELRADCALVAVGRKPTSAALQPDAAGLAVGPRGWFECNEELLCAENIYAVGDANGRVLLAHAAEHQARYAVAHASGADRGPYSPPAMPSCVYGSFEIMRVGPTLTELQRLGGKMAVSSAPLAANAIAQSYGQPQGMVRMLWSDGVLRAVNAAGHGVSHLVGAASLLVSQNIQKNAALPIIFAHPTLDEVLESAMLAPMENMP